MKDKLIAGFRARYGRDPAVIARAPGRLEFIGNHTDYNGGTVLGVTIDRSVWVAVAARDIGQWRFASDGRPATVTLAAGRAPAKQGGATSWVNYPLGVIAALPEFGLRSPTGFDFYALSDLPTGAGLSSSAALELASALALLALGGETAPRETVVQLCRHAENHFVGVPCGILDQGVSGFGRKNHLVFIDCRGPRFATVPLPAAARFWVFNTHTRHTLVDGLYTARHRECLAAAKTLGVALLADATPASVESARAAMPPVEYKRAKHVVDEIARVEATVLALHAGDLAAVGGLLMASHRSSQILFENSTPELDFLVDHLAVAPHVYGARLTGGGFGGAVMAVTSPDFTLAQAGEVAAAYARQFGVRPEVLPAQTGDGAALV